MTEALSLEALNAKKATLVAQQEQIQKAIERMVADNQAHNGAIAMLNQLIETVMAANVKEVKPEEVKENASKRGGK